jgi:hypothetical protein
METRNPDEASEKKRIIENVARAWASMDGKLDKFHACKADKELDKTQGHYMGYLIDAEELIKRADLFEEIFGDEA